MARLAGPGAVSPRRVSKLASRERAIFRRVSKLALTTRGRLDAPGVTASIRQLEAMGAEVLPLRADVTSNSADDKALLQGAEQAA